MKFLLFALALVLGAASCASASTIDTDALSELIPTALSTEVAADVTDVQCPAEVPRGAGLIVECTARIGTDAVTIVVEQTNDDGALDIRTVEALIGLDQIETQAAARLNRDLVDTYTIDCGRPRYQVLVVDRTIRCQATGEAGETRQIDVVVLDDEANFRIVLVS